MTAGPVSLDVRRLRATGVGIVVIMAAAIVMLIPSSKAGLVLYATGDGAARVSQAFTRQTGVPITVVRLSTGPLLSRIAAEGRRPSWTLAWFDGDTSAATLDRVGLLARGVTPAADWSALGRSLLPQDGAWTPVAASLALADVHLRSPPPRQGADVADVVMADPALAGPAYLQVASLIYAAGGWPAGQGALSALRGHVEVAATSPNVIAELKNGDARLGWLQGSTAFFLASRDRSVVAQRPSVGFVLPNVIVQAAGLSPKKRAQAAEFLSFATSEATQTARLHDGRLDAYAWPTVKTGASLPPGMPAAASTPLVHLDPYRWGAVQGAVTDAFEAEVARR